MFNLNASSLDPSNGIHIYVYKKGSGVVPSDVRLFGNDWKAFYIKVENYVVVSVLC